MGMALGCHLPTRKKSLKYAQVDSSERLKKLFGLNFLVKSKKLQQVLNLASIFLSEESSVMVVFCESKFFEFEFKILNAEIILQINTSNGV